MIKKALSQLPNSPTDLLKILLDFCFIKMSKKCSYKEAISCTHSTKGCKEEKETKHVNSQEIILFIWYLNFILLSFPGYQPLPFIINLW